MKTNEVYLAPNIVISRVKSMELINFEIERCEKEIKILSQLIKYERETKFKIQKIKKELEYLKEEM